MIIRDIYDRVLGSEIFKNTKFDYLAHFFMMVNEKFEPAANWQMGFYDQESDNVISFDVGDTIQKTESKAFKRPEHEVKELNLDDVKLDFEEALEIAKNFQKEKFPGNGPAKAIVLLQSVDGVATWNITFVTAAFNVLNIKINAIDKKIISQDFSSLLSWKVN